jgi:Flp pilus assembly protein TadG
MRHGRLFPGRDGTRRLDQGARRRRGHAAVELALLLPFLVYLTLAAVDYARLGFALVTVTNCARTGATWAADTRLQTSAPYANAQAAALADAGGLSPAPTVSTPTTSTDAGGNSVVSVTVTWTFNTIASYPGIPSSTTLSRTIVMPVAPP